MTFNSFLLFFLGVFVCAYLLEANPSTCFGFYLMIPHNNDDDEDEDNDDDVRDDDDDDNDNDVGHLVNLKDKTLVHAPD